MNKNQLIQLLKEIGNDNAEVYIRGSNNFIIPITSAIIMGDGSGSEEVCLISGDAEISVRKIIADLSKEAINEQKN